MQRLLTSESRLPCRPAGGQLCDQRDYWNSHHARASSPWVAPPVRYIVSLLYIQHHTYIKATCSCRPRARIHTCDAAARVGAATHGGIRT